MAKDRERTLWVADLMSEKIDGLTGLDIFLPEEDREIEVAVSTYIAGARMLLGQAQRLLELDAGVEGGESGVY